MAIAKNKPLQQIKAALLAALLFAALCLALLDAHRRFEATQTTSKAMASGLPTNLSVPLERQSQFAIEHAIAEARSNAKVNYTRASDLRTKAVPESKLDKSSDMTGPTLATFSGIFVALLAGSAMLWLALNSAKKNQPPKATSELLKFRQSRLRSCTDTPPSGQLVQDVISGDTKTEKSKPGKSYSGCRILVADDSFVNREILNQTLIRLGAEVTNVDNGEDAVEAAKANRFDMIFMDGCMPLMDGFTATRQIRDWEKSNRRPSTPIVAVTAYVMTAGEDKWRDVGMNDCIIRPFSLSDIKSCLEKYLLGNGGVPQKAGSLRPQTPSAPSSAANFNPLTKNSDETYQLVALVDKSVLKDIRAVQQPGDDLARRMVSLYETHAPAALATITAALLNPRQRTELAKAAHALKSLSLSIGATRMAQLSEALESQAIEGQQGELSELVEHLAKAIPPTVHSLNSACDRSESSTAIECAKPQKLHSAAS